MWPFRNEWKERALNAEFELGCANDCLGELRAIGDEHKCGATFADDVAYKLSMRIHKLTDALRDIADLETPNAAHGVKKAARIAREALGE